MAADGQGESKIQKHGISGYSRGCRCDTCRAAKRAYGQEQHRKRLAAVEAGEANFEHGYEGYTRWKCRCDICREAKSERQSRGDAKGYMRQYRQARKAKLDAGEVEISHGMSGYTNDMCRCETCRAAFRAYRAENPGKQWSATHPEEAEAYQRRKSHDRQAETLEQASRHGQQWTGPELEIAARDDLTARQAALMIGRTFNAVHNVRKKLKADPMTITVAGIATGLTRSNAETVRSQGEADGLEDGK
ncbi:hypothetical protein [Streptomyces sp. ISBFB 2968]|uniref:hypothetical protein n=1 Tax=Streptomyces sp. ISBFB 2968 TaxID=2903527 RepID=UPI002FDC0168